MTKILFIDNEKVFKKWGSKTYEYKINKIKEDNRFTYLDFNELKSFNDINFIFDYEYLIFGWNMTYISKYFTYKYNFYKNKIDDLETEDEIKKILIPILKHKKKILVVQDLHDHDYQGGISNLIKYLEEYKFYGLITPYLYGYGLNKIKINLNYNIKYFHIQHHIDELKFKDWEINKKYDVFLFGNTSVSSYPFRNRLTKILINMSENNKIKILYWKDGVGKNYFKFFPKICNENLSEAINQSWLTICTKSKFNFLLGKYFETSMSNSVICGDMSEDGKEIWNDNYININNDMTDEEIEDIILESLKDKEKLGNLGNKCLKLMEEFYLSKFTEKLYNLII